MTAKYCPADLQLVTLGQLRQQWNTSQTTLWRIRKRDPSFPKPVNLKAGRPCWRLVDLQRWLEKQTTAEQAAKAAQQFPAAVKE